MYGEDPYLTGRYAEAYVQGLQGSDERYLQAAANCKAYMAYAGPEHNRLKFDAKVKGLISNLVSKFTAIIMRVLCLRVLCDVKQIPRH